MFTIVKQARAWWPVQWDGVGESGEIAENRFEMQYRLLKLDEVSGFQTRQAEFADRINAAIAEEDRGRASALAAELVKLIATNWRGVAIEGDPGESPWSDEMLRHLVNEPGAFDAIVKSWHDCMAARPRIRAGN